MARQLELSGVESDSGREVHVTLDGELKILADDGKPLFWLRLLPGGRLEVSTSGMVVKHADVIRDSSLLIAPVGSTCIVVERKRYDG